MIYLDHAATTPLCPEALEAMTVVLTNVWGNPSSMHQAGREARSVLVKAREEMASLLGASSRELYFTSGATESNNWALRAMAEQGRKQGRLHGITTRTEHPSVLRAAEELVKEGFELTFLETDAQGLISAGQLEQAIRPDTAFVSIHWANNEIGSVQPVEALGQICQTKGVPFHVDAVQAIAHYPMNWKTFPADFLTLTAHKFGGPKGTGLLLARAGRNQGPKVDLSPLLVGGRQERGRRAGTENLPAIAGMAAALRAAAGNREETEMREYSLVRLFLDILRDSEAGDFRLHGPSLEEALSIDGKAPVRLPGLLNLYFPGTDGQTLLLLLDRSGVCVSLGSACEAGSSEPSHVLAALGLEEVEAASSIRLSLGPDNTEDEIRTAAPVLIEAVKTLRRRKN